MTQCKRKLNEEKPTQVDIMCFTWWQDLPLKLAAATTLNRMRAQHSGHTNQLEIQWSVSEFYQFVDSNPHFFFTHAAWISFVTKAPSDEMKNDGQHLCISDFCVNFCGK